MSITDLEKYMKKAFLFKKYYIGISIIALMVGLTSCHEEPIITPPGPDPIDRIVISVAQLISTIPAKLDSGYTGPIAIYFNPTKGNGGMANAEKCFAHTGLLTDESKNGSDWKFTKSEWRGANTPELRKDSIWWVLDIPSISEFYGCPEGTDVRALCFVFHDGPGGSCEGKTADGGDIFVYFGEDNTSSGIWEGFEPKPTVEQARPEGIYNGIYYDPADPSRVTLCTYAGSKTEPAQYVYVVGDMTDWQLSHDYQMKRDGAFFWITLTGLQPGKEYRFQYAVMRADGVTKQISDLFSEMLLHPDDAYEPSKLHPDLRAYPLKGADGGYVSVLQPGKQPYQWSNATLTFDKPDKNNLIIYELWVYDYTPERSFRGVMDRLDYIQQLGVNAIELMPVCEFDGNYNWGYSPNHYFAIDKAYGSERDFCELIDSIHARGMAVIMDMVFNHATGLNPMNKLYPYGADLKNNPWFNVTPPHSDNVYEDWNHDFPPAHDMFTRALRYWIENYHIDGYRMDLSHGLCGPSYNAVSNLLDYYQNGVCAADPEAYFILEHWGSSMGSDRPKLIQNGMLCWQNTNNAYCQTAMGWLKDGDGFQDANKDGYVTYCESHDEERMQYKCKKYGYNTAIKTIDSVRLGRVAANVAFNVLLNGPHMIWQYEEIGYDFSINSSASQPNGTSNDNRCATKPRPEQYDYFTDPHRMAAYTAVAQVCQLRTRLLPEVFAGDPTAVSISSGRKLRTIQWGTDVFAAANFSPDEPQTLTLPEGNWHFYLSSSSTLAADIQQSESAVLPAEIVLQPGDLLILTGRSLEAPVIRTQW